MIGERFFWEGSPFFAGLEFKLLFSGLLRNLVGEGLAPPATQKIFLLSYVFADFGRSKPLPYREI